MERPVKKVFVERVEGKLAAVLFNGEGALEDASFLLSKWASSAPEDGGNHKCFIAVEWADGGRQKSAFYLTRSHEGSVNLEAHTVRMAAYLESRRATVMP